MNHQHTLLIYVQQLNPDSLSNHPRVPDSRGWEADRASNHRVFLLFLAQLSEGHFLSSLLQKELNPQPLKIQQQPLQGALSCMATPARQGHSLKTEVQSCYLSALHAVALPCRRREEHAASELRITH